MRGKTTGGVHLLMTIMQSRRLLYIIEQTAVVIELTVLRYDTVDVSGVPVFPRNFK